MDWKEDLYADCLDQRISPEVLKVYEQIPHLLEKHLLPLIKPYGYVLSEIRSVKSLAGTFLSIDFVSAVANRKLNITTMPEMYPKLSSMLFKNDTNDGFVSISLGKAFNSDINKEWNLASYTGTVDERVKQFCEWLYNQIEKKVMNYFAGKDWTQKYMVDLQ